MPKADTPKVTDEIRSIAKEYGSTYAHYRMLHNRTSGLVADVIIRLSKIYIAPKHKDLVTIHEINRLENINQVLSVVLGNMRNDVNPVAGITQAIDEDRKASTIIRKELNDER